MNKVILTGRQTADADGRSTAEGLTIARWCTAVDRNGKDKGADFINCVAFGHTADFIGKYGAKGKKWVIEGRIQTGSYTNKDGNKVYTTDVIVEKLEFGENKGELSPNMPVTVNDDEFMQIPDNIDEELPFN